MDLRAKRGKWEYRFQYEGSRITKVTGLEATEPNRKRAEKLATLHRDELLKGVQDAKKPKHRLFVEACAEFESFLRVEHHNKPNTIKRVLTSLASLKLFFERHRISGITVAEVEKYKVMRLGEHKVKPITLRHDLDNLSKLFRWAGRMRYASSNPVSEVSKSSDANSMRIHIQRGKMQGARRTLRLTEESFELLKSRLEGNSPWSFPSPKKPGQPLTKLNGVHDRVCENAKVLFVLYDLRHTFATRDAAAWMTIPALAAILGHSSLRMVIRYVHPTQEHLDKQMQRIERIINQTSATFSDATQGKPIQLN